MIEKIESVLKRMQWKAHFILSQTNVEAFEEEFFDIVKWINFRKVKDAFQTMVKKTYRK